MKCDACLKPMPKCKSGDILSGVTLEFGGDNVPKELHSAGIICIKCTYKAFGIPWKRAQVKKRALESVRAQIEATKK